MLDLGNIYSEENHKKFVLQQKKIFINKTKERVTTICKGINSYNLSKQEKIDLFYELKLIVANEQTKTIIKK